METATIITLLQVLLQLAPQVPELIQGGQTVISLIESGGTPTPAQQAQIDAMLDAAHAALQAAQPAAAAPAAASSGVADPQPAAS